METYQFRKVLANIPCPDVDSGLKELRGHICEARERLEKLNPPYQADITLTELVFIETAAKFMQEVLEESRKLLVRQFLAELSTNPSETVRLIAVSLAGKDFCPLFAPEGNGKEGA